MSTKYENSVYEEAGSGSESQPPYAVIQQKRPKTSRILVFAIFSLIAINMAISITALVFMLSPTNQESSLPSNCRCDGNAVINTSLTKQEQSDQNIQRQLLEINSKLNQSLEKQNKMEIRTTQLVELTNDQSSTIFDLEVRQN